MSILLVAQTAKVSPATVSRAFNSPSLVLPETLRRIQLAAKQLRYVPNRSASTLRSQRSKTIGVLLPTLSNPVFAECLDGIAQAASTQGYAIVPMTTEYNAQQESRAIAQLMARDIDGLLLTVADPQSCAALKLLRRHKVPYVLLYSQHTGHPCVGVNNTAALGSAVAYLAELGHTKMGFVTSALSTSDRARDRLHGYVTACNALGLNNLGMCEIDFAVPAQLQLQAAISQLQQATVLLCSNDWLAIQLMRTAGQMGLHVPQDLSVMGFDGIDLAGTLPTSLCTVAQPSRDIGRQALLELLRSTGPASQCLKYDIQFGESVMKIDQRANRNKSAK